MIEPTSLDKAYAAGVMDSDGCFSVGRIRPQSGKRAGLTYYVAVATLQTTYKPTLEWFKARWGGHISKRKWFTRQREEHGKNYKDQWRWEASSRGVEGFLRDLYPHLQIKKQPAKMLRCLRYFTGGSGSNQFSDNAEVRHRIHHRIWERNRLLNQRGVRPLDYPTTPNPVPLRRA